MHQDVLQKFLDPQSANRVYSESVLAFDVNASIPAIGYLSPTSIY